MTQQELRDRQGRLIGKIETNGSKQAIRDTQGRLLGTFDGRQSKNDNLLSKIVVLGWGTGIRFSSRRREAESNFGFATRLGQSRL